MLNVMKSSIMLLPWRSKEGNSGGKLKAIVSDVNKAIFCEEKNDKIKNLNDSIVWNSIVWNS